MSILDGAKLEEWTPHCDGCKISLKEAKGFFMCDEVQGEFCETCWPNTPCAKGEHGEGCATMVFQ